LSKIFEAMEQVHRDRTSLRPPPVTELRVVTLPPMEFEVEMLALYRSLHHRLGDLDQKVILFLGLEGGEGASTVVSSLARVAAERLERKVAVLDTDILSPPQYQQFGINVSIGWDDVLKNSARLEQAIYPTTLNGLSVVPVSAAKARTQVIDARGMSDLLIALRERFDLVVVDCAPPSVLPDSITLSRESDGVVLVIAADRTPLAAADSIHRKIASVGGNVTGVVFNKRRHYIPRLIYKLL